MNEVFCCFSALWLDLLTGEAIHGGENPLVILFADMICLEYDYFGDFVGMELVDECFQLGEEGRDCFEVNPPFLFGLYLLLPSINRLNGTLDLGTGGELALDDFSGK